MGNSKIPLCGFDFVGAPTITPKPAPPAPAANRNMSTKGAAVPSTKGVSRQAPKKSTKPSPHKASLVSAINGAKKAQTASTKGVQKATAYFKEVKAGKHAPLVPHAVVAIKGNGQIMLGAVVVTKAGVVPLKLTPAQQAAVDKHTKAVQKTAAAARNTLGFARKAGTASKAAQATTQKNIPLLKTFETKGVSKSSAAVHGLIGALSRLSDEELVDVIGAMDDEGGWGGEEGLWLPGNAAEIGGSYAVEPAWSDEGETEIGVDANGLSVGQPGYNPATENGQPAATMTPVNPQNPPDPNNPGFLMDGTPDPNAPATTTGSGGLASSGTNVDGSPGQQVTAPDGTVIYDSTQDGDVKPLPARGGTLSQTDAMAPWPNVPPDGVVFDWTQPPGWSDRSKGSWLFFYGPTGQNDAGATEGMFGMVYTTDSSHWHAFGASPGPRWIKRFGKAAVTNNDNWDDGFQSDAAASTASAANDPRNLPPATSYGPLIGNPNGQFAGLQYATADDKWFWQSANAPTWATTAADNILKSQNAATIQAKVAAAQAIYAQDVQDAAANDEQAQQALAADALANQQAQTSQTTADAASYSAESAVQTQNDQTDAAAQAAQLQAAQQQAQLDAQAQSQQLAQVDVYNSALKDATDPTSPNYNPQVVAQLLQQGGVVAPDDGSGDGSDDGSSDGSDDGSSDDDSGDSADDSE